jgi:hypothetical protein
MKKINKTSIFKIIFLFVIILNFTFMANNLNYIWQDNKIAPIECVEKCYLSKFSNKIQIQKTKTILPEECKEVCFNNNLNDNNPNEQKQNKAQVEELNKAQVEQLKNQIKEQVEEKNEIKAQNTNIKDDLAKNKSEQKKEILEEFLEQKNTSLNNTSVSDLAKQKNEQQKQIQQEFREQILEQKKERIIKNLTINNKKVEIEQQDNQTIIKDESGFLIKLNKQAQIKENEIMLNNKKFYLPSDIIQKLNLSKENILNLNFNQTTATYQIKTKNKAKLLGLIPVEFEEDYEVDYSDLQKTKKKEPWWKIFVFS